MEWISYRDRRYLFNFVWNVLPNVFRLHLIRRWFLDEFQWKQFDWSYCHGFSSIYAVIDCCCCLTFERNWIRLKYGKNEPMIIFQFHYHRPESGQSEVQIHLFRHFDQTTNFILFFWITCNNILLRKSISFALVLDNPMASGTKLWFWR